MAENKHLGTSWPQALKQSFKYLWWCEVSCKLRAFLKAFIQEEWRSFSPHMAWSLHLLSEIRYMGLRRKIVRDSVSFLEPASATALAHTLHTLLPFEPAEAASGLALLCATAPLPPHAQVLLQGVPWWQLPWALQVEEILPWNSSWFEPCCCLSGLLLLLSFLAVSWKFEVLSGCTF